MRVLLVEDERGISEPLCKILEKNNVPTDAVYDGVSGLLQAEKKIYDVIILDIMLPEMNGLEVLKRMRQNNVMTPVLLLTAKDSIDDKISGFEKGADDYLTKPFGLAELVARIENLLRRFQMMQEQAVRSELLIFDTLKIDMEKCIVTKREEMISLTAKEYRLLCFLAKSPMQVFTKRQIYQNVWEDEFLYDDNAIMALIRRLRKKIEDDSENPTLIQTVWGIGYRFYSGDGE